jgi:hypothetical protein
MVAPELALHWFCAEKVLETAASRALAAINFVASGSMRRLQGCATGRAAPKGLQQAAGDKHWSPGREDSYIQASAVLRLPVR